MTDKILEKIRAGGYDRAQLERLYSNAVRLGNAEIEVAAKAALKDLDPISYGRRFERPIKVKVESIAKDLARENGWEEFPNNHVGNGVKAGGRMRNGEVLADFYFSLRKAEWKRSAGLSVSQKDEASTVQYRVWTHDGAQWVVDTGAEAVELFKSAIRAA